MDKTNILQSKEVNDLNKEEVKIEDVKEEETVDECEVCKV